MHIDGHQHFLDYPSFPDDYPWMVDQYVVLKNQYGPEQLYPDLSACHIDGTIAVQARQNTQETDWLLSLAEKYQWILGVIGWVDLCSKQLDKQLAYYSQYNKLKGFRHLLQDESDPHFMLRDNFQKGIAQLHPFQYTYDLLIQPYHLAPTIELVSNFPNQAFIINHMAQPMVKNQTLSGWKEDIEKLAEHDNVYCKMTFITSQLAKEWHETDFYIYFDTILKAFGQNRLVYGSDWPVSTIKASYQRQYNIVSRYLLSQPQSTRDNILGQNAKHFYRL
ncbi:amidohydrolase family protein [uncultured Shewanella sp.]|uniref:amidohydrolase family protein n=1 Tax=uncultured Shewanella sp. TaxID=173975 RepID=UPI00261B5D4D|nr:amidohydrolase family protein [uncultured Shewanella sp.]